VNDAHETSSAPVACEARGVDGRTYRLTVQGELGEHLGPAFAGMELRNEGGNAVLTGRVRDQAELQGLMQRISDLGLSLVSASAVDEADER
jgi:outer membrane PBP1 activator LpoA protein